MRQFGSNEQGDIQFHNQTSVLNSTDSSESTQRLNSQPHEKSSFTAYKSSGENPSKTNLNCILQNYSSGANLMKNSSSDSEKDSMSENSEDESDVDIVGDSMLC
jgi:hypothetical protein